jgi:feruloyl esterase
MTVHRITQAYARLGATRLASALTVLLIPAPGFAQVVCESLESLELPETTITSAQVVPAGGFAPPQGAGGGHGGRRRGGDRPAPREEAGDLPTFCRVAGVVAPQIRFEVWLPPPTGALGWNGKLNGVGNGGLAGSISYGAMIQALARGYATASTDTGHTDETDHEAWALGHPELLVDFASRSIHATATAAKGIIRAYYGRAPQRSYFTGCSGGGGQALSEAQRYPADYDGIVAGAPANFPTHMWPGELYPAWVTHRSPAHLVPEAKLSLVNDAVLAACDATDGVEDHVLDDPRRCGFDPSTLLCKLADAADCLTAEQVDSVKRIYDGPKDPSSGKLFWPGFEKSSEPGWTGHVSEPFGIPLSYFKYMALQDPGWDWKRFDFADPGSFAVLNEASQRLGPVLDSTDPDLTAFKKRGGKLIAYHGWLDPNIAPRNSIDYYEAVQEAMGGEREASSFYRLFMVPGMGHCGGGPGPSAFDALDALESWVENGKPPDRIPASHVSDGKVDRTRPLCPYPLVARYQGAGSTDEAASFECRRP